MVATPRFSTPNFPVRAFGSSIALPAVLLACLAGGFPAPVLGQADSATATKADATLNAAAEHFKNLGNKSYRVRQRAAHRLTQLGLAALPIIEAGVNDRDAEVRLRCRQLVDRILSDDRDRRLHAFRTNNDPNDYELPGWQLLKSLVQDTPESRRLLSHVLKSEWEFLTKYQSEERTTTSLLTGRLAELNAARSAFTMRQPGGKQVTYENVVSALLVLHDERTRLGPQSISQLLSMMHLVGQGTGNDAHWKNPIFRKLTAGLITRSTHAKVAYQGVTLAFRHNLPEGIIPAVAVLSDEAAAPHVRQYALLAVARFGDITHVSLIEPLLEDISVCYKRQDPRTAERTFECQVRDVALASALHLLNEDPRSFGFQKLQKNSYSVFQPHTLGFESPDQREIALSRWHDYRGAHEVQTVSHEEPVLEPSER